MKQFLIFLFVIVTAIGCNNNKRGNNRAESATQEVKREQLDNFVEQVTANGFFWQNDFGYHNDFLFRKDGTVVCLRDTKKWIGKWYFDKSKGVLQVAWEGGNQYESRVKTIQSDWGTIELYSGIHDYGTGFLQKMKILDDRFEQPK